MIELENSELADFVIEYALKRGAKYAEARLIYSRDESYVARNGLFISCDEKYNSGIGIRILNDKGFGFVSNSILTKDSIKESVDHAIKMAKLCNRQTPIKLSEEKVYETEWRSEVKQKFEDLSWDEKKKYIKSIDKRLKRELDEKLYSRIIICLLHKEKKYFVNSEGTKVKSEIYLPNMTTMMTAKGKNGTEQRNFSLGGNGGWEWFNEIKFDDKLVEDCRGLIKTAKFARSIKFDSNIDVIISGEISGIISHENIGHPSEADRIYGREGAQAGESFYADLLKQYNNNLGEIEIGSKFVTIIDDPTIPKEPGYYLYDDEGVKSRPRYLIKQGKLTELLLNREYAAKFNMNSNAASRSVSFSKEPIIRMANTYFTTGDYNSIEELASEIKKGIYIKSFTEWNIDDRRFQSKYVGLESYLIENGKITETLVKRPILELTTFGILKSVDGITKNIDRRLGLCGKGDPMQGIPVSMGGAEVRLRNIKI